MQRISSILGCSQIVVLLFIVVGSYAWSSQVPDEAELMKRMYSYVSQLKRPYNFGLGKRSLEEAGSDGGSFEDFSSAPDSYNYPDKKATAPNSMYSFGLGKKNRAYGFGLGKRLESLWKFPSAIQSNRQERRSKIYSFGLGKRGQMMDDYDEQNGADKRSASQRQFSFGLGKRDVSDASHATASTS